MKRNILILGGTRDAVELAALLVEKGFEVTTSLAGVTSSPATPKGALRIGGFGGVEGLAAYAKGFDLIADATHPFAARISATARSVATRLQIPCVRLERPAWQAAPGDHWTVVSDASAAAAAIPSGSRVLLTIGRKDIQPFLARADVTGVIRMIEAPQSAIPANFALLRAQPPFTVASETALFKSEAITVLVTKNAGGDLTRAKIDAARATSTSVIIVSRPEKPPTATKASAVALAHEIVRILA